MKFFPFPNQLATNRNVSFMLLAYLFFVILILPKAAKTLQDASGQPDFQPLDLRPGFSAEAAWKALDVLGESGRESYLKAETFMDVVYPFVYGVFFAIVIAWLFRLAGGRLARMTWLAWTPLIGTIFDWLENIGIVKLIYAFPERADDWAHFASNMGLIKWLFSIVAMLLIMIGLGAWGMMLINKRS